MGIPQEEMGQRLPEIEAFADIGQFFDQPVKTYSSGMFVRLAFASAVSMRPDILVIDEALAVGDIGFQQRCLRRIGEIQKDGTTILMVSHDTQLVSLYCSKVILLSSGRITDEGHPESVSENYMRLLRGDSSGVVLEQKPPLPCQSGPSFGSDKARILSARLENQQFESLSLLRYGDVAVISTEVMVHCSCRTPSCLDFNSRL